MVIVKYEDLAEAFDFVSFAAPMEHQAYISRATGAIHWLSDAIEDDVPEDLEESDQYIPVPHKNDLDLGSSLALRFAAEALPNQYRRVESVFRRRGAYARFKDLLAAEGCLERWYAFESECTETALKRWCAENDIQVIDTDKTDGALRAVGSRESRGKS